MIVINLKGGLGNQMFQYATGKYLAHKNETDLLIHKSFDNKKDTQRNFELDKFNLTCTETDDFKKSFLDKVLRNFHFDYEPKLIEKKFQDNKKYYLDGYFQSEKNFLPIRDVLLKEFSLKSEFQSDQFLKLSDKISQEKNSISIHVRRGDYIIDPKAQKHHGSCSLSYYKKAVRAISKKISEPKFYIFSDDPEWVLNNLKLPNSEIISGHGLSIQEEMILMSKCKHNIVANSSFSWWGAWLNQNNDKMVIAPTPWVDKKPSPQPNIRPESWITLPKN